MAELARRAASNGGRVLEIGFGLGIAANFIQQHELREHWIIEANDTVFEALESWAATARSPVQCVRGFWEAITPRFPDGIFDGILFDPYPISVEQSVLLSKDSHSSSKVFVSFVVAGCSRTTPGRRGLTRSKRHGSCWRPGSQTTRASLSWSVHQQTASTGPRGRCSRCQPGSETWAILALNGGIPVRSSPRRRVAVSRSRAACSQVLR